MIRLLFINILLLPLFIYSQNIEGSYYSTDGKCKINLTIGKKNDYIFYLKKRKIKRGSLNITKENKITYLDFNEISSMYSNDTIYIQNSGNSNNEYLYFNQCNEKFIYLVKKNITACKKKKIGNK